MKVKKQVKKSILEFSVKLVLCDTFDKFSLKKTKFFIISWVNWGFTYVTSHVVKLMVIALFNPLVTMMVLYFCGWNLHIIIIYYYSYSQLVDKLLELWFIMWLPLYHLWFYDSYPCILKQILVLWHFAIIRQWRYLTVN